MGNTDIACVTSTFKHGFINNIGFRSLKVLVNIEGRARLQYTQVNDIQHFFR
jgi:hypothetical protein